MNSFIKSQNFDLDSFQIQALNNIDHNINTIISAHTGSGKTLVAEYVIYKTLIENKKTVYTSPIKTISNQKYREFQNKFPSKIGIITGDTVVNENNPCLIMTTEILLDIINKNDSLLDCIEWIVFDEVHYINDEQRGGVWEQCLIQLPQHINIVLLSATLSNIQHFSKWIQFIRNKELSIISTDKRPVPLIHKIFDQNKLKNLEAQLDLKKSNFNNSHQLIQLLYLLKNTNQLPALIFCFSKDVCQTVANVLLESGIKLQVNVSIIDNFFKKIIKKLSETDQTISQIQQIKYLLMNGIGIHHSGLLPICKELIEILFCQGNIMILVCTETFAMGVNAPAKSVVFYQVSKFDNKNFRLINYQEFTQMSGRAGRRGLDQQGLSIIPLFNQESHLSFINNLKKQNNSAFMSQFQLKYSNLLNIFKYNIFDQQDIISKSFAQYQNTVSKNSFNNLKFCQLQDKIQQLSYQLNDIDQELLQYIDTSQNLLLEIQKFQNKSIQQGRIGFFYNQQSYMFELCVVLSQQENNITLFILRQDSLEQSGLDNKCKILKTSLIQHLIILETKINQKSFNKILKNQQQISLNQQNSLLQILQTFDIPFQYNNFKYLFHKFLNFNFSSIQNVIKQYVICQKLFLEQQAQIQYQDTFLETQYKKMIYNLQLLQYIDQQNFLLIKGTFSSFLTCFSDEIVLTEYIFQGNFKNLSVEEIPSFISIFMYKNNSNSNQEYTLDFSQNIKTSKDNIDMIVKTNFDIINLENLYLSEYLQNNFNYDLCYLCYEWANQKTFQQICQFTQCHEGQVAQTILRINQGIKQLIQAFQQINEKDLSLKLQNANEKIQRGIIFQQSLYIQ